jgi:hypothetical protein
MSKLSRRAVLSTGASAAVATLALGGVSVAATDVDPILSALDAFRRAQRQTLELITELDELEGAARTRTGEMRPHPLITWRNYFISGGEIDLRREDLLSDWAKGNPKRIARVEAEYLDAKKREQDAIAAGREWDARNGLTQRREQLESANAELWSAVEQLAESEPTTVAGCAAVVGAVAEEFEGGEMVWFEPALVNAAQVLERLAGGQANV